MKHVLLLLIHVLFAVGGTGCIKAPDIVLLDHATALEQQAAGDYAPLERQLTTAGMAPRPTPFSRDQLEAAGAKKPPLAEEAEPSDAEQIDLLLKERCLGEALDGTLVETRDSCRAEDVAQVIGLVDRANRDREQIWRYLRAQRPRASAEEVRRAWRAVHLAQVPCGGQVQRADGRWEPKAC
jgi:hypothetical protein